ncbi:Ada metal-binding domain-containing protein [uncultured Imperialibacter sp.]|uniref:Ada metal-binding domain-containing protein n=1 Tax=uncultured Imperialibacter sp. TaxID=1672639 RepID=UPI0030DDB7A5|tara:strand:- start:4695 stop:4967 length:273 start_codon:yes stop_codon:yes gene_type:complete
MIRHTDLGNTGFARSRQLSALIRQGKVTLGGNSHLKIYGQLSCPSGKRMKPANRVFFLDATEALQLGFRPCGHCMREEYGRWKRNGGERG